MTSAYPRSVDALMPEAQRLADELGRTPSRNQLMSTLRVGRDKARAVLARLAEDNQAGSAEAVPAVPSMGEPGPVRRLHAVPDTRSDDQPAPEALTIGTESVQATDRPVEQESAQMNAGSTPAPNAATRGGLSGRWAQWRGHWSTPAPDTGSAPARSWPLVLLALPAFVAIWSGWVGLGTLTGFGPVHPLPGIADGFTLNTAITLPIGVETYAAYALRVWLAGIGSARARGFAKWSAIGSLVLGALGQVAYHLMTAQHLVSAPWPITTAVACLPVIVLGFGAALAHLQHATDRKDNA
jgi:hypothetical protein